jgi:hypothetical protein
MSIARGFWVIQRIDEQPVYEDYDWVFGGDRRRFVDWTEVEELDHPTETHYVARWVEPQETQVAVFGRRCFPTEERDEHYGLFQCVYCRRVYDDDEWQHSYVCTEKTP